MGEVRKKLIGDKTDVFTYEIHPTRSFPGSTLPH